MAFSSLMHPGGVSWNLQEATAREGELAPPPFGLPAQLFVS